ncbi:hypothetical protein GGU10DRAFT_389222 [Lentinula aff. detonsa]|uniref:Uncharacterized protein n=1 Tax=Lentinula aff. detonsa TaxID=2804958 RepID=A0AA38KND5_9AGAR|nr:hypothetical protein GGU10DRAFT_389222 [Lentinula aff. detonsa]
MTLMLPHAQLPAGPMYDIRRTYRPILDIAHLVIDTGRYLSNEVAKSEWKPWLRMGFWIYLSYFLAIAAQSRIFGYRIA